MRFTIDTETDSYEDAIRTVRAAYGKPQPEPNGRPEVLPEDVVWKPPSRYDHPAWTEEMLRSWVKSLHTVEELDVVWRVCAEPGPPGVRGQVIAEYISPELTGKPALTALGIVSRRMNTAARELWARGMPFVIDEVKRTRTVDRSVAAILLDALAEHPLWPRLRHHSSPPALGS
ncbi:hypothetical protein EES37_38175 [Streptomyces sp. ADI91-18]|uniref:hypothetical protein n=1 Tax=Streptomyces sp. ADI91-18 TaxID=1522755 RepID=UPI000F555B5E|nr:hypothetical protein [Streptomyces sp. ADI91-18]RPK23588.1 hypothetical protein EES37_38175 [Streptomyces sp. ADI91-18]